MVVLPTDPLLEGAAVELVVLLLVCAKAGDKPATDNIIPHAAAI
jgi:hypothetical protein